MPRPRKPASPFRYFNFSPKVIRLVVLMYVRFSLSLRKVGNLLFQRGIDICHETVRVWWNRFGPLFAGEVRRKRVSDSLALSVRYQMKVVDAGKRLEERFRHLPRARSLSAPAASPQRKQAAAGCVIGDVAATEKVLFVRDRTERWCRITLSGPCPNLTSENEPSARRTSIF